MGHVFISAAHKSSGKTLVSVGLAAALRARGLAVQTFKKGPDYIDPLWLSAASGRPCHNLDFHTQSAAEIVTLCAQHQAADVTLIEGNKGLHDGMAVDGSDSNAALASLLGAPVVLVIDCRGMTRGIAALVLGLAALPPRVSIGGVILNRVGGARHEAKLRQAIAHYTDVSVLGAVHERAALVMTERHLGLVPANEAHAVSDTIRGVAQSVAAQVDLDAFLDVSRKSLTLPTVPAADAMAASPDVRIGIARDAAFGFYYEGDLSALRRHGADLVFFDTLNTPHLPPVDGLFLGGGFPECHLDALSANVTLRGDIFRAVERGLPVYAECGGLMYLSREIAWEGRRAPMVGAVPADTVMRPQAVGRGYMRLRENGHGPWPASETRREIHAHEFHHSVLTHIGPDVSYAYDVVRGTGIDGRHDGLLYRRVLAGYAHLRDTDAYHWTERFVEFVRTARSAGPPLVVPA